MVFDIKGSFQISVFEIPGVDCSLLGVSSINITVKILKFGTPQTIAIIVLKIEKFDVTLH